MKTKGLGKKVLLALSAAVFLIAFLETALFYRDTISNQFYLLLLSIMNGIRIFGISSTLDIFEILQTETIDFNSARGWLNNLYIVCYFGAPLITAKIVVRLISYFAKEKLMSIAIFGGEKRILIVGYNEYVEKLAKDIIASKKEKLLILHKNDIPENIKFEFKMSGVLFKKYEKLDFDETEYTEKILDWLSPKKVKRIILFEEKEMDNVSNYFFFLKCLEQVEHSGFINSTDEKLEIDCNYNLSQVEELIWSCFDKTNVQFEYSLNTFSIPMLRAQSVLENYKVYENILDKQGECKDIHLLIIGFGRMGRRFFKRAINQSIVSERNNIIVDIVEKDIDKTKLYLERMCKKYYNSKENMIHIGSDVTDGDLKIRIHGFDINDIQFIECMERISEENPFTYIVICIDNPEESINCMLHVENYLQERGQCTSVLVRMDSGQQLKKLENIYDKLHLLPGDDDIISLENICSEGFKTAYASIHEKDDRIQRSKTKYAYQIEARKYRVLHYDAKKEVVKNLGASEKARIRALFQSPEYTSEQMRGEFINSIKEDELLRKFGAIEHRRWSYYMILSGWTYGKIKNENNKETPYLCPFEEILNDHRLKQSAYYEYKDWYQIFIKESERMKEDGVHSMGKG